MAVLGGRRPNPAVLTYLSEGSEIEGNLKTSGSARIDGRVKGSVIVEGDLEIGSNAQIEGEQVRAQNIIVHGQVNAQITASGKLHMTKTARVEGDIRAMSLDVEAGAVFVGRSQTGELRALPQGTKPGS
ncbi:MAG: polymer-forming cytoskeletal protein [Meiothermus sp.]|uniref:bactofilin family protein n=1 Tax=Meiothermus sp. TaxID=1955249 RepID=UPI0025D54896|nr:polymer-forming cytoskeletal protein [Meiothermus sp.]MCS7058248.1 polymer-forming cytoskeletal protein [Meiothermus sp.]MCS7194406.1 polymer-forming cytoskeletal protein [Meiothermus sp.]MCX7740572.1 polymer-forming cytoskeletal protein [Meiothermus sp.]MDW8089887.1 polymer-forming cytoskeletal protein [Meiothermus sp.]MDW8481686.1 polymer-forming cytoskeletal protein [Meiothermus sp.]